MLGLAMAKRFPIAAFVVAIIGAAIAAFAPLGRSCGVSGGGPERCSGISSYEIDGAWVLVVVSVPVLLSLLPVVLHRRGWTNASAVLLWTCCIVGIFSVGLYFVPAAVLMTFAAAMPDPRPAPVPG
jgi:hypothetical protein